MNLSKKCRSLPPKSSWRSEKIFVEADLSKSTRTLGTSGSSRGFALDDSISSFSSRANDPLSDSSFADSNHTSSLHESNTIEQQNGDIPIGVPVPFESDMFKGYILFRFKNIQSEDPETCKKYFEGKQRLVQFVVQGTFKQDKIPMNSLFVGDEYEKPLQGLPPRFLLRGVEKFFQKMVPAAILQLTSSAPKVMALYAGNVQTLCVDLPGEEPDIANLNIMEATERLGFTSSAARKRTLQNARKASKYFFDTKHVYTFDNFDHVMDIESYQCRAGLLGKFDMVKILNGAPMGIGAVNRANGEWMFRFRIHHERLLKAAAVGTKGSVIDKKSTNE